MSPEELKLIVKAWGGAEKFAAIIGVKERTVYRWLSGKPISEPTVKLINTLKTKRKREMQQLEGSNQ